MTAQPESIGGTQPAWPPPDRPPGLPAQRRWARGILRVTVTVEALLAFGQAILAGGFLQGHYGLLDMHQVNGILTAVTAVVMAVAAVVQWRPGNGPLWPVFACLGLVAAVVVQMVTGFNRILAVHVPLGVAIIVSEVLLLVWVWRPVGPGVPDPTVSGLRDVIPVPSGGAGPTRIGVGGEPA